MEQVKKCSKCGEVKPLDAFFKNKSRKDGLAYDCKPCNSSRHAAWRVVNPEKTKAIQAAYRKANPEKFKAFSATCRKTHARPRRQLTKKDKETRAAWKKINREKCNAYLAAWKKANPERIKSSDRYISKLLCCGSNLNADDIPQELIQAKRLHLQLSRAIKESKNGKQTK